LAAVVTGRVCTRRAELPFQTEKIMRDTAGKKKVAPPFESGVSREVNPKNLIHSINRGNFFWDKFWRTIFTRLNPKLSPEEITHW
jgi:hypothetical protein